MQRPDGRTPDELRPLAFNNEFVKSAAGSTLFEMGGTRVICTASLVDGVPGWREASGKGWLTAEYSMLPASTGQRRPRDVSKGRLDGRTTEIQRLIGRSLRAICDMQALGPRSVYIDCDVLEADGGTRCASICGGYVALEAALARLVDTGELSSLPLTSSVAAVSCGIVDGEPLLDLCYAEDSTADVDMNVVMTGAGELVEVQASAEGATFSRDSFDRLLAMSQAGVAELTQAQRTSLVA